MLKALKFIVTGIVQGVGFRPSVYRIAEKAGVKGYVRNMGGSEVEVHIEGDYERIRLFVEMFKRELPPVAEIDEIKISEVMPEGYQDFRILPSQRKSYLRSIVPPDFSVCEECMKEVLDERTRWYKYPFNSCAFCGPRYSIMEDIPYDRERISMRDFPLCRECLTEYRDPKNLRRFHAQGISCPVCGPSVWLTDREGRKLDLKDPIMEAAKLIDEGYIIAIKGIGGFHIASLASDDEIVLKLRRRKRRPQKPFAVMVLNMEILSKLVHLEDKALDILLSPQRPIVLLPSKNGAPISEYVAPGLTHIGVFLPYTPLHHLLLNYLKDHFAIMTSGNPPGEPMCIKNWEALVKLRGIVDYFLFHNRRIVNRVDDSVVRFTHGEITMLRRSRGYAPHWIKLKRPLNRDVVVFGAMLQNAGGIGFEDKAVLTQFIGDCDDYRTLQDLHIYLKRLTKLYRINIKNSVFAVDLHPRYPTLRLAAEWSNKYKCKLIKIQHHWAHIASVMAEYGLEGEVPGIAIDGAGFGIDGQVWGGEVILASYDDFKRVGHLGCIPMPGGDLATDYPARLLIGALSMFMGEEEVRDFFKKRGLMKALPRGEKEFDVVINQIKQNPPIASSMGRILDAVSVLLGVSHYRSYEGEPAMKLEAFSKAGDLDLEIPVRLINELYVVDTKALFEKVVDFLEDGVDRRVIAYNVQRVLGESLASIAIKFSRDVITVSGGAAVNSIIIRAIKERAQTKNVKVLINKKVPPGDGGIALGQIVIVGYVDTLHD